MASLKSVRILQWAFGLLLVAFISQGAAFQQELWLYDAQGNALYFTANTPNMSDFTSFLPKVTRRCTRGGWILYSLPDYGSYYTQAGSSTTSNLTCSDFTFGASVKSLRHFGSGEASIDALSLYAGEGITGEEILVTSRARTEITINTRNFAATGTSDWALFEGKNLDGNSHCFSIPPNQFYNQGYIGPLNLTTIGSVFKGCDSNDILTYKKQHILYNFNKNVSAAT